MNKLFLLLFTACLIWSCGSESSSGSTATNNAGSTSGINYNSAATTVKGYTGLAASGKTKSGFEFIKHVNGNDAKIKEGDYAYFRYHIKKRDSVLMTSSGQGIGRLQIPSQEEIDKQSEPSPVLEGILQMGKGDSLSVFFPVKDLPRPVPGFENDPFIIYSMFLVDVKDEEAYLKDMAAEKEKLEAKAAEYRIREGVVAKEVTQIASDYKAGNIQGIQTSASGLKYVIHEQGTGAQAENGNIVLVQYYGSLTDGKMFDNSFKRGKAFNFPLGQGSVIKGWDEGIALLKEGAKATFFIPPALGYGAAGSPPVIPGNSELIFYVELEQVIKQ